MLFCEKCGSIMIPGEDNEMKCNSCGYSTKEKSEIISEKMNNNQKENILESQKEESLPIVKITCAKCNNNEAYYWIVQTRAADEAPTRFYKCTKCSHTWREYD
ncbi:MAG: transcription factor S [Candidatus Nanoarchaeia archaeon]|nr:transcription factor S [Candidatus Nanoarchaeia archaeon]